MAPRAVGSHGLSGIGLVRCSFALATAITHIASCTSRRLGAEAFPLVWRAAVILALSRFLGRALRNAVSSSLVAGRPPLRAPPLVPVVEWLPVNYMAGV